MKAITISSEAGPTTAPKPSSSQPKPAPKEAASEPEPEPGIGESNLAEQQLRALQTAEPVINGLGLSLKFIKDQDTGRNIIQVYDAQSGEVIRQIPPDDALSFLRRFDPGKTLHPGQLLSRNV